MPFVLITLGIVLFITAMNGTYSALGGQLYKDFVTNKPPFGIWFLALLIVGMIGYIPGARKPADTFMALIIVTMVISNGGVFQKFQQAISQGPKQVSTANPLAAVPISATGTSATAQNTAAANSNPLSSVANSVISTTETKATGSLNSLISGITGGIL